MVGLFGPSKQKKEELIKKKFSSILGENIDSFITNEREQLAQFLERNSDPNVKALVALNFTNNDLLNALHKVAVSKGTLLTKDSLYN